MNCLMNWRCYAFDHSSSCESVFRQVNAIFCQTKKLICSVVGHMPFFFFFFGEENAVCFSPHQTQISLCLINFNPTLSETRLHLSNTHPKQKLPDVLVKSVPVRSVGISYLCVHATSHLQVITAQSAQAEH